MTVFEQSGEPAHAALSEASFLRCPWPRPVASGTSSQLGAPEGRELDSLLVAWRMASFGERPEPVGLRCSDALFLTARFLAYPLASLVAGELGGRPRTQRRASALKMGKRTTMVGLTANSMIVEKAAGRGGRRREAAGNGGAGAMIIERGEQWEQHDSEAGEAVGSGGQHGKHRETPAAAGSGGKRREAAAQGQWLAQKKVGDKSRTTDGQEAAGSGGQRGMRRAVREVAGSGGKRRWYSAGVALKARRWKGRAGLHRHAPAGSAGAASARVGGLRWIPVHDALASALPLPAVAMYICGQQPALPALCSYQFSRAARCRAMPRHVDDSSLAERRLCLISGTTLSTHQRGHNLAAALYIPLRISRSFASPTAASPHASIPPSSLSFDIRTSTVAPHTEHPLPAPITSDEQFNSHSLPTTSLPAQAPRVLGFSCPGPFATPDDRTPDAPPHKARLTS
ncbi:hypothetical protein B0H14DRAFT_2591472 [Mycena olivaceomarginata]|nr:hypothetical protein B0H14DRAFT_2591472 [Mycena olivaceomarginata]